MAGSLCCPPEILTTLLIGCTPIKNKKVFFFFLKKERKKTACRHWEVCEDSAMIPTRAGRTRAWSPRARDNYDWLSKNIELMFQNQSRKMREKTRKEIESNQYWEQINIPQIPVSWVPEAFPHTPIAKSVPGPGTWSLLVSCSVREGKATWRGKKSAKGESWPRRSRRFPQLLHPSTSPRRGKDRAEQQPSRPPGAQSSPGLPGPGLARVQGPLEFQWAGSVRVTPHLSGSCFLFLWWTTQTLSITKQNPSL